VLEQATSWAATRSYGMVIWVERIVFKTYVPVVIFDPSAVITAVYASHIVMIVRFAQTETRVPFLQATQIFT